MYVALLPLLCSTFICIWKLECIFFFSKNNYGRIHGWMRRRLTGLGAGFTLAFAFVTVKNRRRHSVAMGNEEGWDGNDFQAYRFAFALASRFFRVIYFISATGWVKWYLLTIFRSLSARKAERRHRAKLLIDVFRDVQAFSEADCNSRTRRRISEAQFVDCLPAADLAPHSCEYSWIRESGRQEWGDRGIETFSVIIVHLKMH